MTGSSTGEREVIFVLLKIVVIIIVININLFFNPREIFYLVIMTIFEFKIIIIIIVFNEGCMLSELKSIHA